MAKYIALLRGINVSVKNKLPMANLRSMFEVLDYTDVSTYLQSGNVVFSSNSRPDASQFRETLFMFIARMVMDTPKSITSFLKRNSR